MAPISSFFSPFLQVPPSSVEDLWSSEEEFKNVRSLLTRRSSINGGGQGRGKLPCLVKRAGPLRTRIAESYANQTLSVCIRLRLLNLFL